MAQHSVNIPRDVIDDFYRYRRPELCLKAESGGHGTRTAVLNLAKVAEALHRPPGYLLKYFGYELATAAKQTRSAARKEEERFLLDGTHGLAQLDEVLEAFIRKYVLCPRCRLPETKLAFSSTKVALCCAACGSRECLGPTDRLLPFMLKNRPAFAQVKGEVVLCPRAAAKKQEDDDGFWHSDLSPEAVARRRADLCGTKAETLMGPLGLGVATPDLPGAARQASAATGEEMRRAVASRLFGDEARTKPLATRLLLLKEIATSQEVQIAVLQVLGCHYESVDALADLPAILAALYHGDVVEEASVEAWASGCNSSEQLRAAKPFLQWLRTAEEES